jgi:glucose-6-phosphate 1-epimerase
MNDPDIALLNQRFGAPGRIAFRTAETGLPVVSLANRYGTCEVSLYGGHVLQYRPTGHAPALFLSKCALFEPGKPIRGGIPICWPWFGPNPDDTSKPLHGFARILQWGLSATEYTNDVTELRLSLEDSERTRRFWPFGFSLSLRIWLDQRLNLELTTTNRDTRPFAFTQAFHPYFLVRDIMSVTVHGLDKAAFTDLLTRQTGTHEGPLLIRSETDRIFTPVQPACALHDAGLGRALALSFSGTPQMVVWNPWVNKSRAMPDFGDDEYLRMLCLEPANGANSSVTLDPGEQHTLTLAIQASLA